MEVGESGIKKEGMEEREKRRDIGGEGIRERENKRKGK